MLRQRLAQVPGFDAHLTDSDDEDEGEEMDPVSSLWRCLRKGTPLLTIYNSLQPPVLLEIDGKLFETEKGAEKAPKVAAFKFVKACLEGDLQLPPGECFSLQDLFGDDTTGFVKASDSFSMQKTFPMLSPLISLLHYISADNFHFPGHTSYKHSSRCGRTAWFTHDLRER